MSNDKKVNLAFEYRATKTYNKKFQSSAVPSAVPSASAGGVSAAELMRRAKKEEEAEKLKKKAEMKKRAEDLKKKSSSPVKEYEESEDEEDFVSANEESENEEIEVEIEEDEEEKENSEEVNRRLINERLMSAINNMNQEDQTNFKVSSSDDGFYIDLPPNATKKHFPLQRCEYGKFLYRQS